MTKAKIREYELNRAELDSLNKISEAALPEFTNYAAKFLTGCAEAGFQPRVSGASFSLFTLTNIVRALLMCSGMPADEVDTETVDNITYDIHMQLAQKVGAYVASENIKSDPSRN
jgi:hypothetical protein